MERFALKNFIKVGAHVYIAVIFNYLAVKMLQYSEFAYVYIHMYE